jgi:hypothetical protein
MVLKRIFLCSVDSPNPDEAMAQTRADRPELAMKLRHLEYFVAAAEELNFTRATDRLHVSQPPFSKQIQGAVWKKNGLYSGVVSSFVATLSQVCAATARLEHLHCGYGCLKL